MSARNKILLLIAAAGLILSLSSLLVEQQFGVRDFSAFWSGSALFMHGYNPYDQGVLMNWYRLHAETQSSQIFWNQPWTLSILWPLGLMSFHTAAALWLTVQIFLFAFAIREIQQILGLTWRGRRGLLTIVVIVTFVPTLFTLQIGQITSVVLASLAAFLALRRQERHFLAGLALSLSIIKPQLLWLVYLGLLLSINRPGGLRALLGLALGSAALFIAPLLVQPQIYSFYLNAPQPVSSFTANLGAWIQSLAPSAWWLRFLPAALLAIGLFYLRFSGRPWRFLEPHVLLAVALPASLVGSPYCWTYDFSLLLPTALLILVQPAIAPLAAAAGALVAVNILLLSGSASMQYDAWYPVVLAAVGSWGLVRSRA